MAKSKPTQGGSRRRSRRKSTETPPPPRIPLPDPVWTVQTFHNQRTGEIWHEAHEWKNVEKVPIGWTPDWQQDGTGVTYSVRIHDGGYATVDACFPTKLAALQAAAIKATEKIGHLQAAYRKLLADIEKAREESP